MGKTHPQTDGFLGGLMGMFARSKSDDAVPPTGYEASAGALEDLLEELHEKAEARRQLERQHEAALTGRMTGLDEKHKKEAKHERLEQIHVRVRADVLEMHERLGTGIAESKLTELDEFMREWCEVMAATPAQGVEPYIRGAVARRFFDETGPIAWDRFTERMDAAGIEWPAPDEHAREHQYHEAKELFVNASPVVAANLVTGVVDAWQDHYPSPDSLLWRSLCLRACGAGIRARMMRRGLAVVQANGDELRAEGESLLREEIDTVRNILDSGVRSVEEADQIMAGAGGLLEHILPDLCWARGRSAVLDDE